MTTSALALIKKLLVLFLLIGGLYISKAFLIPLFIAGVVATLFLPFCKWMESKKLYRGFATSICLLVILLFIGGLFFLVGWQVSALASDFVLIKQRALETSANIQDYIFNHFGITLEKQSQLLETQQANAGDIIPIMAGSMASGFINFFLTLVYIFGLLYYRAHVKKFLLMLAQPSHRDEVEKVIYRVANVSQQYLFGLSKMIVCLWIMYSIGFSILGVKNAFFFAILCGLLEIVPFIGNITGTTITVLVSAVQGASLPIILGIIITYGIVQFIQGWVLEPLIVGSQVKINPLFTIIALVVGELIWGIAGIFLAIPLIAMFKIVCDHVDTLKPYGFLIGEIETVHLDLKPSKKIVNLFKSK
ncbi:MAG: AI-2E family transporter [Saprospiraceae bacterium]|nr:AI-2E family transporter [Candidatus Defluviibacterium haderslevense]